MVTVSKKMHFGVLKASKSAFAVPLFLSKALILFVKSLTPSPLPLVGDRVGIELAS